MGIYRRVSFVLVLCILIFAVTLTMDSGIKKPPVIGMHTSVRNDVEGLKLVGDMKALSDLGINLLIVQVDYNYRYESRPELASVEGLSFEVARAIGVTGKSYGIRVVPEINCLGHQSDGVNPSNLLSVYPEFDETPGLYAGNEGIYARSWCPLNEAVNPIIFDLVDELIDAFQADAFHVGMDEVFIIGSNFCPRCHGSKPSDLFAKAVNDLHAHLVGEKKVEMFMWADRLIDGYLMGDIYGDYEAAYNETAGALLMIPRDIILCDWHYSTHEDYPSIELFMYNNFRMLTASFNDVDATTAFVEKTIEYRSRYKNILGHIYTTWSEIENDKLSQWPSMVQTIDLLKDEDQ